MIKQVCFFFFFFFTHVNTDMTDAAFETGWLPPGKTPSVIYGFTILPDVQELIGEVKTKTAEFQFQRQHKHFLFLFRSGYPRSSSRVDKVRANKWHSEVREAAHGVTINNLCHHIQSMSPGFVLRTPGTCHTPAGSPRTTGSPIL